MRSIFTILFALTLSDLTSQPPTSDLAFAGNRWNVISEIPAALEEKSNGLSRLVASGKAGKTVLGYSRNNQPVEAYYFPGFSEERALVIGGLHGSELSSVEVARQVIAQLQSGGATYYSVVVIPELFPDNADKALSAEKGPVNKGRYTSETSADPNRQMPVLGKAFDPSRPLDSYGRPIEKENRLLLQLIQEFAPARIANLHAIKDVTRAGIYADPRTDCQGIALGFEADSMLAVSMASLIHRVGGRVPGNKLESGATALYYNDPCPAGRGGVQRRNLHGSSLPNNRGYGVSLGSWATTAICDGPAKREAMQLITVEFPGYKSSGLYADPSDRSRCLKNVLLYARSIVDVFLEK